MRRRRSSPKGLIYFITTQVVASGDIIRNAVKIGYTEGCPKARLAALQCGCPSKLELGGFRPGNLRDERIFHMRFEQNCFRGEWFDLDAPDVFAEYLAACEWAGKNQRGEVV